MKKPTCKCGTKMDLKTEGQFDTSTWKIRERWKTKRKYRSIERGTRRGVKIYMVPRAPVRTKIKGKTVYQILYQCSCGQDFTVRGKSRAHALTLAYGMK